MHHATYHALVAALDEVRAAQRQARQVHERCRALGPAMTHAQAEVYEVAVLALGRAYHRSHRACAAWKAADMPCPSGVDALRLLHQVDQLEAACGQATGK